MSQSKPGVRRIVVVVAAAIVVIWTIAQAIRSSAQNQAPLPTTHPTDVRARVNADSSEQAGKYIVLVGGCNDCHTPGYMQSGRDVPEDQWLIGMPVGFRGAWGTTYPSNLRTFTAKYATAEEFIQVLRARKTRPPMPWESLHAMSDDDLRAVYAYLRSLPVVPTQIPEYVAPGIEPKTPYIPFEPVMPSEAPAAP